MVVAAHLQDPLVTVSRAVRLSRAGLRTCAWTVNAVDRARDLAAYGVEWIITDTPGVVLASLGRHPSLR